MRRPTGTDDEGETSLDALELDRFREIVANERPHIVQLLRWYGVRDADLEDSAQEVLVVLLRRWKSFDSSRAARPWLRGIAQRVASEHLRRAHVRRETPTEDEPASDAADAEAIASSSESRESVRRALARVKAERRPVLVRHDVEEASMAEIAAELGIGVNTAYSRLRLAREDMRREMAFEACADAPRRERPSGVRRAIRRIEE